MIPKTDMKLFERLKLTLDNDIGGRSLEPYLILRMGLSNPDIDNHRLYTYIRETYPQTDLAYLLLQWDRESGTDTAQSITQWITSKEKTAAEALDMSVEEFRLQCSEGGDIEAQAPNTEAFDYAQLHSKRSRLSHSNLHEMHGPNRANTTIQYAKSTPLRRKLDRMRTVARVGTLMRLAYERDLHTISVHNVKGIESIPKTQKTIWTDPNGYAVYTEGSDKGRHAFQARDAAGCSHKDPTSYMNLKPSVKGRIRYEQIANLGVIAEGERLKKTGRGGNGARARRKAKRAAKS